MSAVPMFSLKNRPTSIQRGNDAVEIREFFHGYESEIGLRSTFGSFLARMNGVMPDAVDHEAKMMRAVDSRIAHRGRRVWSVLRELDRQREAHTIVVLFRLFGDVAIPFGYASALGLDAGKLASLTDAAERAREDLALKRGTEREEGVRTRAAAIDDRKRDELAKQFWYAVRQEARYGERAASADAEKDRQKFVALARSWRQVQRLAIADYQIDGRISAGGCLSARLSSLSSADKETTIDEAIAERLGCEGARYHDFVVAVKRDATKLKDDALAAYARAKQRIGA